MTLKVSGPSPGGKYYAKVVGKALATLDELRRSDGALTLGELTARLGMAKPSLFRILHTLEAAGYLERDAAGGYRAAASLRPTAALRAEALTSAALPAMTTVLREFRETVSLAMLFDNHIEVVATLESPQLVRMGNTVGRILPPHASSLGKAITAFQPPDRRRSLMRSYGLHRFTPHTITDEDALARELDRIRRDGLSLDAEENAIDGCCFGVPIPGPDGSVWAALSLSMPKRRLRPAARRERIVSALKAASATISRKLRDAGGSAPDTSVPKRRAASPR